jgi:hypothetical protein
MDPVDEAADPATHFRIIYIDHDPAIDTTRDSFQFRTKNVECHLRVACTCHNGIAASVCSRQHQP